MVEVDPATRGLEEGWRIGVGGTTLSQSGSDSGGVAESCSSDTVEWWEAVLSLAATASIVMVVLRWPPGEDLAAPAVEGPVAAEL